MDNNSPQRDRKQMTAQLLKLGEKVLDKRPMYKWHVGNENFDSIEWCSLDQ